MLGERDEWIGRQIAASGEKGPDENLVTVARRHREEVLADCEKTIQAEENFDGRHVWGRGSWRARRVGRGKVKERPQCFPIMSTEGGLNTDVSRHRARTKRLDM